MAHPQARPCLGESMTADSAAEVSACDGRSTSPLLALPDDVLDLVECHLLPVSRRRLRCVCRRLRALVDEKVLRLEVDRHGVNPARFPALQEIVVTLWQPRLDELDLLPLLTALPTLTNLQAITIRPARAVDRNRGGGTTTAPQGQQQGQVAGLHLIRAGSQGLQQLAGRAVSWARDTVNRVSRQPPRPSTPPPSPTPTLSKELLRTFVLCHPHPMQRGTFHTSCAPPATLPSVLTPTPSTTSTGSPPASPGTPASNSTAGVAVAGPSAAGPSLASPARSVGSEVGGPGRAGEVQGAHQRQQLSHSWKWVAKSDRGAGHVCVNVQAEVESDVEEEEAGAGMGGGHWTAAPRVAHTSSSSSSTSYPTSAGGSSGLAASSSTSTSSSRRVDSAAPTVYWYNPAYDQQAGDAGSSSAAMSLLGASAMCMRGPMRVAVKRAVRGEVRALASLRRRQPDECASPVTLGSVGSSSCGAYVQRALGKPRKVAASDGDGGASSSGTSSDSISGAGFTGAAGEEAAAPESAAPAEAAISATGVSPHLLVNIQYALTVRVPQCLEHLARMKTINLTELRLSLSTNLPTIRQETLLGSPTSASTPPPPGVLTPLTCLTTLKRLSLNFFGSSGEHSLSAEKALLGGSGCSWGWEAVTQGLGRSLSHLVVRGCVGMRPPGFKALAQPTSLSALTLWLLEFLPTGHLTHLSACTALTSLQVARLSLDDNRLQQPLPQVKNLGVWMILGHPSLLRLTLPNLTSACLRDFPCYSDPNYLTLFCNPPHQPQYQTGQLNQVARPSGMQLGPRDTTDTTADTDAAISMTQETGEEASPGLSHLVLMQHASCFPWGSTAHLDKLLSLNKLSSLKSLSFKHFTTLEVARDVVQVAAQLPRLDTLSLTAGVLSKPTATTSRTTTCTTRLPLTRLTHLRSLVLDCQQADWDPLDDLVHDCMAMGGRTEHSRPTLSDSLAHSFCMRPLLPRNSFQDLSHLPPPHHVPPTHVPPPHPYAPHLPRLSHLSLTGSRVTMARLCALLAITPGLKILDLIACDGVTHEILDLPEILGRPTLMVTWHTAPTVEVQPSDDPWMAS